MTHDANQPQLISAIVPATNAPPTLERCLAALRNAHEPPDEIIVVRTPEEAGPARARNDGAMRAKGDVLLFVDADVVVHRDAVRRVRRAFADTPEVAAVFGSYDDEPAADDVVSTFRNLLHHHVHQTAGDVADTFWAGLGAVRRDVFVATGGFDAARFPHPSIEDVEFGMRLSAAGGRIRIDRDLQGTHLKRWNVLSMVMTDFDRRAVPWTTLLLERGERPTSLNLSWKHRFSVILSAAAVGSLVTRRNRTFGACAAGLLALNMPLYALLLRKRGSEAAVAGVFLHLLHHLTIVAAVPVGMLRHVMRTDVTLRRR
jgi:hypothetical protein